MEAIHFLQQVEASESINSFVVKAEKAKWHGVDVFRIETVIVSPKGLDHHTLANIKTRVLPTIGSLIYRDMQLAIRLTTEEAVEATKDETLYDHAWQLSAELIDAGTPYIQFSGEDAVILAGRRSDLFSNIASWLAPNEVYTFPDDERKMWRPKKEPAATRDFYAFAPKVRRNSGLDSVTFRYENVKAFHRRAFSIECAVSDYGYTFLGARCANKEDAEAVRKLILYLIDTTLDEGLYKDYRTPRITKMLKEPHENWKLVTEGREVKITGEDASFAKISIKTLESLHERAGVG